MALPRINLDVADLSIVERAHDVDGGTSILRATRVYESDNAEFTLRGRTFDATTVNLAMSQPEHVAPKVRHFAPPGADYVDTLCLRHFSFDVQRVTDQGNHLIIESLVEDREGYGKMPLTFTLRISSALKGRRRALRIRRLILWALMHELDECLSYADGTPVMDPHPEQRDWQAHRGVHPAVARMSREAEKHERKAGVR
jgi:hypothetical protein